MDVYEAYKVAVDSGDLTHLKAVFPKHYLITGIRPALTRKSLEFANAFPEAYEMREVDSWVTTAYILSGKHSYEQLAVYVPTGTDLRLEYENYVIKHAWLMDGEYGIDVSHNIPFIRSIPHGQGPINKGFVHGVISGCDDAAEELKKVDTSEVIPGLKFIVCYAIMPNSSTMTVNLDTLKALGFTVAMRIPVAINKWDAVKKSASLAIGSGAPGYECFKLLVMHDDYRLVDKLQGRDTNRWGFVAYIKHPRVLMEVRSISWKPEIFENKVAIIPYAVLSYNDDRIFDFKIPNLSKAADGLAEMRVSYADVMSGKYHVGDVLGVLIEDQKFVDILRELQGKAARITPSGCPSCGHMLDVYVDKLICTNPKCVELVKNNVSMWVNTYFPTMDPDLLGRFIKAYSITSIADIYTTIDSGVVTEEWFADLHTAVKSSRAQGLAKFLTLLCPKLTLVEADRTSSFVKMNVPRLCRITKEQMMNSTGMILDKAADITEWMSRNMTWFEYTLEAFVGHRVSGGKLFGKTFIISGLLYERDKLSMENRIRAAGGRVIDNGKHVDYIIAGQFADEALLKRAQSLHVPPTIIRETSFKEFIKDCAMGA